MNIVHVIDHLQRYNGMVHAAVDLACQQAQDGHSVAIWSTGGDLGDVARRHGVEVITSTHPISPRSSILAMLDMKRAVKRLGPSVIHAHMVRSALLAWPVSRLSGSTLITSIQNSSSWGSVLMIVGDGIITGCNSVMQTMRARGIPRRRMRPVLNGTIGSARFKHPPPESITLSRPAILTICGLHPRKGVADLIAAFQACLIRLPHLHLYIVGDGPGRVDYEAMVVERGIGNVHFCGYVSDTRAHMAGADAFVLASLADPAPLVLSEAREAGLAVVASKVDGIPEMLEEGQAGLLVKPGDPADLERKLAYLFGDTRVLEAWRQRSQLNLQRMRVSRVAAETVQVYKEFIRMPLGKPHRVG